MNSTAATTTQLQSVGDLVGHAFTTFRQNIPLILKCQLFPITGLLVGRTCIQYVIAMFPHSTELNVILGALKDYAAFVAAGIVLCVAFGTLMFFRQLALAKFFCGMSPNYQEAEKSVNKRFWHFVALGLVGAFIATGAIVVCLGIGFSIILLAKAKPMIAVAAAIGALVMFIVLIFLLTFVGVVFHVMYMVLACEKIGIFETLGKGCKLVFNDFGRAVLFSILLFTCIYLIAFPMTIPIIIANGAYGAHHAMSGSTEPLRLPLYLVIGTEIWNSLLAMVTWPLNAIAFGYFYCDLRNRQEGLDLERKLAAIENPLAKYIFKRLIQFMKDATPQIEAVANQYHYLKPPQFAYDLERAWVRFWEWVKDLLDSLKIFRFEPSNAGGAADLIRFTIVALGILATIALIWLVIHRIMQSKRAIAKKRAGQVGSNRVMTAQEWQSEADRLAQEGDYREACRALYLTILRVLHENKVAEFAPTKTNYEYYYSLAPHPKLASTFKTLANLVESFWFGNKQASEEDFQQLRNALAQIRTDIADREVRLDPASSPRGS